MEECHVSAVLRWQECYILDEKLECCQWVRFQTIDAFGCCVRVDVVKEVGVEMVQVCKMRVRKAQSLSFFEPILVCGHLLCGDCK